MPSVSPDQMAQALTTQSALVSFPTDTVPALAARPENAGLIFEAKRRPPEKPLILMGARLADLLPYIKGEDAEIAVWQATTAKHWPGQLTLVLPASDRTPPTLNPTRTGTIGIRVPNHPIALQLLSRTGPLATTSANLSGQPPLTTQSDISRTFPAALTLAPKAYISEQNSGQPSTVARWIGQAFAKTGQATSADWQILRQGEIQL
ncbi:MAG: L-threonylcarbamoyladenylate synthase [Cyanobacteria bacterium J06623_5]